MQKKTLNPKPLNPKPHSTKAQVAQVISVGGPAPTEKRSLSELSKEKDFEASGLTSGVGRMRNVGYRGLDSRGLGYRGLDSRGLGYRGLGFRGLGF